MGGAAVGSAFREDEEAAPQEMRRYEIYWARLDPAEGSEMKTARPCVVVSDNARNATLATVVVCPLTSTVRPHWRTRLQVTCAGREADVSADQIRTVSKGRLGKKLGALSDKEAATLRRMLGQMYGDG